jgi:PD-(D/E)XK nuclease superfamily
VSDVDLTPKQREIRDDLLGLNQPRPRFAPGLATDLRDRLSADLEGAASTVKAGGRIVVSKFWLGHVLACEGRYAADLAEPFAWTTANVRGKVAHGAIERHILSSTPPSPLDLVERTLVRLAADDSGWGPGPFLRDIDTDDRLDIVRDACDAVTKFVMDWPPIPSRWTPRVESSLKYPFHDGRIELNAKPDLALGLPRGDEARVLIVDFKTGRPSVSHKSELHFYALVETLVRGTPPFRIATYYLDSGLADAEDVTVDMLWDEARRVAEAGGRMARVQAGEQAPTLTASPLCNYCPVLLTCVTGQDARGERAAGADGDDQEDV